MSWVNLRHDILAEFAEAQRKSLHDAGSLFFATMATRAEHRRETDRRAIENTTFKLRFGPRLSIPRPAVASATCPRCGAPAELREGCKRPQGHKRADGNPCFG